jgi:hypothetical protein
MCLEGGGCGGGLLREEGRDHQFVKELMCQIKEAGLSQLRENHSYFKQGNDMFCSLEISFWCGNWIG